MCGIAGFLDLEQGVNMQVLQKMTDVIRHRGPDDEGYLLFSKEDVFIAHGDDSLVEGKARISELQGDFFLGISHRRLSILDTSPTGHQPMQYQDSELFVTYNGEIYNYIELKHELMELGYTFSTECDTEVLLVAYKEWGEHCVERFNGMWAFCIYDSSQKKLFCSRDRFGQKPFHYYQKAGKFLFASELKQLCQDSRIHKAINEEVLASALIYGLTDYDEQTLICDFVCLPAAHNMTIDFSQGKIEKRLYRYWDIMVTEEVNNQEEIQNVVYQRVSESIRLRLRSDVPVGALLSGGLDSSCMVTEIAQILKEQGHNPAQFNTFTSCYENDEKNDESYFANLVNEHNGLRQNFVYPQLTEVEKAFEEIIWHIEGFGSFAFLGVDELLRSVHQKGIKVILNGQNGDETMFGYERYYAYYFADLLKRARFATFINGLKMASKNSKYDVKTLFKMLIYFNIWQVRKRKNLRDNKAFLHPSITKKLNDKKIKKILRPKSLRNLIYNELTATQLTHILRHDDRLYMKHSIESRVPFIDYRYVAYACQIHPHCKIKEGYTKHILRKIFDDKMPKEVTWRINKMGFQAPTERWTKHYSIQYLDDLLKDARSAKYFNLPKVREELHHNINGNLAVKFITTEVFMRKFDVYAQ